MTAEFRRINSRTLPLTRELAEAHRTLPPSGTERVQSEPRIKMLEEKVALGELISFQWATAKLDGKTYRVNGQHSSTMLARLNGNFPDTCVVHLDEFEVDSKDGLVNLFRQYDPRKSSRSAADIAGAYQGIEDDLLGVARPTAKLAVEGVAWWRKNVEGVPVPKGDSLYELFAEERLHSFIRWVGDIVDLKTPELRKVPVVAAMYACFEANEEAARSFWREVARGGIEFEEAAPSTVLDNRLKALVENKVQTHSVKPGEYYHDCIFAWNASRADKTISSIKKFDPAKGWPTPAN